MQVTPKHVYMLSAIALSALVLMGIAVGSHLLFAAQARKSPQWQYVAHALAKKEPDYDLRNCVDLEQKDRRDFTKASWRPLPCINTATSCYNPDFRAGNCARFVQNPARWGFREVSADEAVPGDLVICFMASGYPRHAVIYTQDSLLGPLCATTVLPGWGYFHYVPYKIILGVTRWFGSFKTVRYYRYKT